LNDCRIASTRFLSRRDHLRSPGRDVLVRFRDGLCNVPDELDRLRESDKVDTFSKDMAGDSLQTLSSLEILQVVETPYRRSRRSTHSCRMDLISTQRSSICRWMSGSNCSKRVVPPYTYTAFVHINDEHTLKRLSSQGHTMQSEKSRLRMSLVWIFSSLTRFRSSFES
jgi:hypothetical protein